MRKISNTESFRPVIFVKKKSFSVGCDWKRADWFYSMTASSFQSPCSDDVVDTLIHMYVTMVGCFAGVEKKITCVGIMVGCFTGIEKMITCFGVFHWYRENDHMCGDNGGVFHWYREKVIFSFAP